MRTPVLAVITDAAEFEAIATKKRRLEWRNGPKLDKPVPDGPLRDAADKAVLAPWFDDKGKRVVATPAADGFPLLCHAQVDLP